MFGFKTSKISYIDAKDPQASNLLAKKLQWYMRRISFSWDELVFLCIGSDRITGDSLGPLIGRELSLHKNRDFFVYGTLEQPVHAMNLDEYLLDIALCHPNALTVAIDASLGRPRHQHHITIGAGSIHPGAGAGKKLPQVGDIFITGIVSSFDSASHSELQALDFTRILCLADTIARGILLTADICRPQAGSLLVY